MAEGIIKKLTDKGFGFIDVGDKNDLFFHASNLEGGAHPPALLATHRFQVVSG